MDKIFAASIDEVSRLCKNGYYDFIVVGSGMGGGNIARALIDHVDSKKNKKKQCRVLMIERGRLLFTTHCVNTSCPRWNRSSMEGPSMDTDIVYRTVRSSFSVATSTSAEYDGGPVHCLGRSNVWGLYTPRIHPDQLKTHFPPSVCEYLNSGGYNKAYQILSNDENASLSAPYPKVNAISAQCQNETDEIIANLNSLYTPQTTSDNTNNPDAKEPPKGSVPYTCGKFSYCPMGVQFVPQNADENLYNLTMGAFSAVNWELEHAYNKSESLTILLETQVMTVNSTKISSDVSKIESLTVRDKYGRERTIGIGSATVILCAGTVETAAIALRSDIKQPCDSSLVGKGLIDHDIWGTRYKYLKPVNANAAESQSLKVQSWVKLNAYDGKSSDYCLLNITINAPSFLGHVHDKWGYIDPKGFPIPKATFYGHLQNPEFAKKLEEVTVQVVFEFCSKLKEENRVLNLPEPVPTLDIRSLDDNYPYENSMKVLAANIKEVLEKPIEETSENSIAAPGLGTDILFGNGFHHHAEDKSTKTKVSRKFLPNMSKSTFGTVAHEVGTMRMGEDSKTSVVDEDLRVHGYNNLFVCDLSVFPVSPSANPSLTLVALAQRLGKHLRETR